MSNGMVIFRGTVVTKKDRKAQGIMTVVPDGADVDLTQPIPSDSCVNVRYVSPYIGGARSGRVEIPEAGAQIIYCTVSNDIPLKPDYFYLGSIYKPDQFDIVQTDNPTVQGDPNPMSPADSSDYEYTGQSMTYGVKTPTQKQMVIQEGRDKYGDSQRIKLKSTRGHMLSLDDSSETSKVNLASAGQDSGLELRDIVGDKDPAHGPSSFNLYAKQSGTIRAWEGGLKIDIVDGNNMAILNNSTGSKVSGNVDKRKAGFGNIEIHTDRGDVLIRSGGNGVFIDCYGKDQTTGEAASFQVRSQNRIHLYSSNGIDLKSSGDINIDGANVNIKGDKINLNPTESVSSKMRIRKTNNEILAESVDGTPKKFFSEDGNFDENYNEGRNTSGPLT